MPSEPLNDPKPMQKENSIFNFIDSHLKELRWTAYGLGGLAIFYFIRRTRSTSKFIAVKDVPKSFILKNYRLQGAIKKINDDGLLMVEHIPIMELKYFSWLRKSKDNSEPGYLPVTLAGVQMSEEGKDWLQANASEKPVWFHLLDRDDQCLHCHVKMQKSSIRYVSLNKELIKQGLCSVREYQSLPDSQAHNRLIRQLIGLEHKAAQKGKGMWKEESRYRKMKSEFKDKISAVSLKGLKSSLFSRFRRRNKETES